MSSIYSTSASKLAERAGFEPGVFPKFLPRHHFRVKPSSTQAFGRSRWSPLFPVLPRCGGAPPGQIRDKFLPVGEAVSQTFPWCVAARLVGSAPLLRGQQTICRRLRSVPAFPCFSSPQDPLQRFVRSARRRGGNAGRSLLPAPLLSPARCAGCISRHRPSSRSF